MFFVKRKPAGSDGSGRLFVLFGYSLGEGWNRKVGGREADFSTSAAVRLRSK
jgi:hypothetical protein